MKIKSDSIKNIGCEFKPFFKSLEGCNYVILFDVIKFSFSENVNFSQEDLSFITRTIVTTKRPIDGVIKIISFLEAQELIKEAFSYVADDGHLNVSDDQNLIKKRLNVFWKLIKQHFTLSQEVCYQHISITGGYFDFGVMWNLCFILLNEHNQGIIIYAAASD